MLCKQKLKGETAKVRSRLFSQEIPKELPMKQKALRTGDAHSHEDEECRKRSTLCFGRCLTSATGAQQRARRENVILHNYDHGKEK